MKTKEYAHLITVGEAEAKAIQELLRRQGISSTLHPSSMADVLAGRAVHENLPYEIRVPKELLDKARNLLNLEKPSSVPKEKHGYPHWVILLGWLLILVLFIVPLVLFLIAYLKFH